MGETSNFGILTNTSNIYDAVDNRNPSTTEIIYDSKYNSGSAIKAVGANQLMFDTGVIPAGTFSGVYDIGIFYDCPAYDQQGRQLMRWAIYENGVLMPEDTGTYADGNTYMYDLNTVDESNIYGLHTTIKLKASCTYQIKVTTSGSISTRTAILDYISLARQPENSPVWGRPNGLTFGSRDANTQETWAEWGSQLTIDVINGNTGYTTLAAEGNLGPWGYTWSAPFKHIVGAWPVVYTEDGTGSGHGRLLCTVDKIDVPNSQVQVTVRNVSTATATASTTFKVRILVVGFI